MGMSLRIFPSSPLLAPFVAAGFPGAASPAFGAAMRLLFLAASPPCTGFGAACLFCMAGVIPCAGGWTGAGFCACVERCGWGCCAAAGCCACAGRCTAAGCCACADRFAWAGCCSCGGRCAIADCCACAGRCATAGAAPCAICPADTGAAPACCMAAVIPMACPTSSGMGIYSPVPCCPGKASSRRVSPPPSAPSQGSCAKCVPSGSAPIPATICASKGASVTSGSMSPSRSANCSPKPASDNALPTAAVSASSTNLFPNWPSAVMYFCASALEMKLSSLSLRFR